MLRDSYRSSSRMLRSEEDFSDKSTTGRLTSILSLRFHHGIGSVNCVLSASQLLLITRDEAKRSATRWRTERQERRRKERARTRYGEERCTLRQAPSEQGYANVEGDDSLLSFAGTVGDRDTPAVGLRELRGLDGLGDCTDLVHLAGRLDTGKMRVRR